MENIDEILKKRFSHYGLGKIAQASLVCQRAQEVAADKYQVISFKKGVLSLKVQSSAAACELRLCQTELIEKINQALPSPMVEKLKFRVG